LKQLWYNLYPTPSQYIEKFRKSPEVLRLLGSESKFIKDLSSLRNDISQKIEVVSIDNNAKLFEKRKSKIHDAIKSELNKYIHNDNMNNNIYAGEDTTKSPLKPLDTQINPLIEYINRQSNKNYINISENKKIEELNSAEINSKNNFLYNF